MVVQMYIWVCSELKSMVSFERVVIQNDWIKNKNWELTLMIESMKVDNLKKKFLIFTNRIQIDKSECKY
jgi:hypothetical protein